ncbi:MAG: RNase adapter RapZ [Rhodospirillales bacterium]|nr:RNase adapter RapZ [Rhodospirillales bacterium]
MVGDPGTPDQQTRKPVSASRVVFVTGMSGAGKTSVLKALQDLGYETVDHVPMTLMERLVTPTETDGDLPARPIAIGIDVRTRAFDANVFLQTLDRVRAESDRQVKLVFLDCDDGELRRRYTVTRHRHPLAVDRPLSDGIAIERRTIHPLRSSADQVIDTTHLNLGELKRLLETEFGEATEQGLAIFVTSFSFRLGLPREADLVFDVRFLNNPYYDTELRLLTGRDEAVAAYVRRDRAWDEFVETLFGLLKLLVPRYEAEGKSYLTIAIGCTGGRHRSVFVAEQVAAWLAHQGLRVRLLHRDVDRT